MVIFLDAMLESAAFLGPFVPARVMITMISSETVRVLRSISADVVHTNFIDPTKI